MSDKIRSIEVFPLEIARDTPYLGPLEEGVARQRARLFRAARQPHDLQRRTTTLCW